MHVPIARSFVGLMLFEVPRTVLATYIAGIVLFVVAAVAAKDDVAKARGLDKVVALGTLFFSLPLAVFAMEHFFDSKSIMQLVPKYMPWPLFWTYFVGCALLAASLSFATKIQVVWSGLLFGIMMFSFALMLGFPGTVADPHNRFNWALSLREPSFASGSWILAATAMGGQHPQLKKTLVTVGRTIIGIALVFYGVEHFLHPLNVPGIPLPKLMPVWIPGRMIISFVTGAILFLGGWCILLAKKVRMASTYVGSWIALLVFTVYLAILIASFSDPSPGGKLEAVNYFTDTMLYAGAVLALARSTPDSQ